MARRLEDFFLILEAVMTKVRAEEEIARMELDKPYEPDLPLSTPRFGPQTSVEEMGDAPPLDNSGAYLAKPNTSNNKYGSSSISDAEDSECSREGSESSGADSPSSPPGKASYEPNAKMAAQVNRRSNIAKPGVHFTPPDANKEGPKATPKQSTWRPARQATPRSVPMKSSPDTSIFTKPSQFSIDSSPPVTVTPAQRERSRGIGPRAGRGARNGRQPRMSTPKVTQSQPLQEPTTLRRGRSVSKQLAMSLTGVRSPELSSTAPAPLPRELWPQRPGRRQAAPGRGNRGGRGGARNRPRTPTPDENEEEETQEQGEEQSREQSSEQSQAQNVGKEETQKRSAGNSPKLSGDLDIIEEDQAQFGEEGEKEQEEEDSEIDSEESYGDTDDSEDED
ncbi:hypothetical protein EV426DRAFT_594949 [Tirmania nivea]|nr:hypothetical protein EV426DRAFT_594949 [Tirmania nivea]